MQAKLQKLWPSLGFILCSALYGLSLSQGWSFLAYVLLVMQFVLFFILIRLSLKHFLAAIFIAQVISMLAASWWFRNIEALGWAPISGISPQVWLMGIMFLTAIICTAVSMPIFYAAYLFLNKSKIMQVIYTWGLLMLASEFLRAVVLSAITRSNGIPIEPTWNIYSAALLTSSNIAGYAGRTFGFWGTSFLVYISAGFFGGFIVYRDATRAYLSKTAVTFGAIIAITIIGSFISYGKGEISTYTLAGLSQGATDPAYLERVKDFIPSDSPHPVIVVLPEYSNLIHPYTNTSIASFNLDIRDDFIEKFQNTQTYFVGTEDEFVNGTRYTETYVANGSLEKTKRAVKTFLIPGGEYVPSWIKSFLGFFDEKSVTSFLNNYERHVLQPPLESTIDPSGVSNAIGPGACSALLKPYYFRDAVSNGATVLAANVSFEQFNDAPQYEQIANRFSMFNAKSLRRPLVIGARMGSAVIYDESGKVVAHSDNVASTTLQTRDTRTIYALLGDTLIIFLVLSPLFYWSGREYIPRNNGKSR